jgi:hypothetical protein
MKKISILLLCLFTIISIHSIQARAAQDDLEQLKKIAYDRFAWFNARTDAIWKITEKGSTIATPILTDIMKNSNSSEIHLEIIAAFEKLKDKNAVPALEYALNSPSASVRERAKEVLEKIKAETISSPENILECAQIFKSDTPFTSAEKTKEKEIVENAMKEVDPSEILNNILLYKTERRDPAAACLLSMATLGGGQIYNYQPNKAAIAFVFGGISYMGMCFPGGQILGGTGLLITWIWSMCDSYNSAVDINKDLESEYKIELKR